MDEQNEKELAEEKIINDAFQHLLDSYLASKHRKKVEIITKAFNFARQAHKGVRRLSGEPYIMHPIAVAQIACSEIGLGSTSICSALLHDVVEDTDYTIEDIENIFGHKIAQIVEGLTKISGGIFGDKASAQAENFKKLLLTMSDDIRVILIKICDRLHNMRTLASQSPSKQYKIAGETLYIYAPLSNRLGLNKIKTELEDLSFKYEHPEEYKQIEDKLALTQTSRDMLFAQFTDPIKDELDKMGLAYEIKARVKSPYSIWNKMQNKHITFEEVFDILAVRIIFTPKIRTEEVNECFNIYVAISRIYKSHPDRLRDWLNHPKANGYQALHVTLMSKQGRWIEVQIRSDRMDEIAEQGFAAHWKYKERPADAPEDEGELEDWLHTIKEILDDPQPDAMDFLDAIKLNLFASEIFVFTPKGEIKTMPADCTALDFAFSIHTFLGSHCIGAKVNHKLVPLSHKLQSGDQVEILTSKSQHVQRSWINFVSTAKAKAKIQAMLRREGREFQKIGEEILSEFLKENDIQMTTSVIDKLCEVHEIIKHEEFYQAIGEKTIVLNENDLDELRGKKQTAKGWRKYVPFMPQPKQKKTEKAMGPITVTDEFNRKKPVILSEETIGQYILAPCCNPIPGDDILGYIDNNNQIEIHKRACSVASKLKSSFGNRILDARWDMHKTLFFDATITINGIDHIGLLNNVTQVISEQMNVNIHRLTISCDDGIFDGTIELRVHDRDDVKVIINNLKNINGIEDISQIKQPEPDLKDTMMKRLITLILIAIGSFSQLFAAVSDNPDTLIVARDGTGQYRTINEAIDVCRAFMEYHKVIFVKKGVYKEKVEIPSWLTNIEIVGEDVDKTIITYDDHANIRIPGTDKAMGTFRTFTVKVEGSDITFKNITIENNAAKLGQAVALHTEGDRLVFIGCKFLGNQDTVYTGVAGTRILFKNCYIEGTTDFIFGPSTAWFENCTIFSKADSYVTAASTPQEVKYGYVFDHCKLTAAEEVTKVYLGRPWRPYAYTLFIKCEMGRHIRPEGWFNWSNPANEKTARYLEYNNSGEGANTGKRVAWSKSLTKKEAQTITKENVFLLNNNWLPQE